MNSMFADVRRDPGQSARSLREAIACWPSLKDCRSTHHLSARLKVSVLGVFLQ